MHGLERIPEVIFFARSDTLRRGHTLKIYTRKDRNGSQQKLFSQRVVIPWNELPEKVVCSKSTLQFKIEYDKFWGVLISNLSTPTGLTQVNSVPTLLGRYLRWTSS